MKVAFRNLFLLGTSLLLTVMIAAQAPPPPAPANDYAPANWMDFISVENNFRARFPRLPQEIALVNSETSEIIGVEYRLGNEGFIVYTIKSFFTPEQFATELAADSKALFEQVKNQEMRNMGSNVKIIGENALKRGECPAFFVEYDVDDNMRFRSLHVACESRYYRATIRTFRNHSKEVMGSERAYGKIADAFLQSFTPLNKKDSAGLKSTEIKSSNTIRDEQMRFAATFQFTPQAFSDITPNENIMRYEAVVDKLAFTATGEKITDEFAFADKFREVLYGNWKKGFIEGSKAKVLAEKNNKYKNASVKDFIFLIPADNSKIHIRILALNGKLYTMSVTDKNEKKTSATDASTAAEAEKFFNSFEKLPEFSPPKYIGTIYDGIYSSEFYGFSINVPRNWEVNGGQLMIIGQGANGDDIILDEPKNSLLEPIFLKVIKPDKATGLNNVIEIEGKFIGQSKINLNVVAKEVSADILKGSPGSRVVKEFAAGNLNGTEVWQGDFEFAEKNGRKIAARIIIVLKNGYLFTINGFSVTPDDRLLIESVFKSLNFF